MRGPVIKRGLWTAGTVAALAAVILALLPLAASNRIVGDRIALELAALTGYRVAIGGATEIHVWPRLSASLGEVSLSRWSGPDDAPPVLRAERVEADLSAMAALAGHVVFSNFKVVKPVLQLSSTDGGVLPAAPEGGKLAASVKVARGLVAENREAPDLSGIPSDALGGVSFEAGQLVDPDGQPIATALSGRLDWPAMTKAAALTAVGVWRGEAIELTAASPAPMLLLAGGTAPLTASWKSALVNLSFDGTATLEGGSYVDGQASLAAPSLRRLLDLSDAVDGAGDAGSLAIDGRVAGSAKRLKVEDVELDWRGSKGTGALDLIRGDGRPLVSGSLAFGTLDLAALLAAFAPTDTTAEQTTLAELINLDLRLSAGKATAGAMELTDVAASARIKDGQAAFDISDAGIFGGSLQAGLRVEMQPAGDRTEVSLLAADMDGAQLAKAAGVSRLTPAAPTTISANFKGTGPIWRSLDGEATGTVSATFGPGSIAGIDVESLLKRTQQGGFFALDDVGGGSLQMTGAEVKAMLSGGVATISEAAVQSAPYRLTLSGIVPYLSRGLALSGTVERIATDGPAQPAASFFVGGSWGTPFISPAQTPAASD